MSQQSYVTWSPLVWNCTGDVGYRVQLKTRSNMGSILTVDAADASTLRPVLRAHTYLKHKVLFLTITHSGHSNFAGLRHTSTDLSDGQSHYLTLSIQCWPLRLSLRVDDEDEQVLFLPGSLNALSPVQLKIRAGSDREVDRSHPSSATIGCFQVGTFQNAIPVQTEVQHRSSDAYTTCINQCFGHPCRHVQSNRCINFHNDLRCNCFGSGYDGSRCELDGKAVLFNGTQQLFYALSERNSQPSRIAIIATNNAVTADNFMVINWQNENSHGNQRLIISLINGTTAKINSGKKTLLCPLPTLPGTQNAFVLYIKFEYHARSVYVKTKLSSTRCQFWLGDPEDVLILKSVQVGMDSANNANFVGCIKEFYVDYTSVIAKVIDHYDEALRTKHPVTVGCPDDEDMMASKQRNLICDHLYCRHGTACEESENGLRCNCSGSGYTGHHCQFAALEKNCQSLYDLGERRSGVYQIDPDGSGPLDPVHVMCKMSDDVGNAWTMVSHNFPASTQVRSNLIKDTTFFIEYNQFSHAALRRLIRESTFCRQRISYVCNRAPLDFPKSTWFRSAAYVGNFSAIGQSKGMCPCGAQNSCAEKSPLCNCDANSPQNEQDVGYNYNQHSGIIAMTFMNENPSEGWANVTLGPLECTGPEIKDVVQFTGLGAILYIAPWKGKSMLLWFRTGASSNSVILEQKAQDGRYFMITIENGSKLQFQFDLTKKRDNGKKRIVELDVQGNDVPERWHRITVEHIDREIRFTCDRSQAFYLLQPSEYLDRYTFTMDMHVGRDEKNEFAPYFGCLMQLNLDGHDVDFEQSLMGSNVSGVKPGCQNFCLQSPCLNDGICYEDYAKMIYGCHCQNPWAHIGNHCETDINKDSDVAFLDVKEAYLTIRDLRQDALSSSIVFSFRTDQAEGLLLYAHDQFYNFIQIHLSEESKVVLTLNDLLRVKQCAVTAAAPRFNNLHWNQVAVIYGADGTRLCVDKLCCSIDGQRNLQSAYIFRFNDPESILTVIPPRAPVISDTIFKYNLLYVGGLPSMPSRSRTKRQAVYLTNIKKFVGCMRGFRIGSETIDLKNGGQIDGYSEWPPCLPKLNQPTSCNNGGYNVVNWRTAEVLDSCVCRRTSYTGPFCADDVGLHLDGGSYASFDMRRLEPSPASLQRLHVVVRFSFSSTEPLGARRAMLIAMVNQRGVGFNIRLSESFLSAEFRGYYKSVEEKMKGRFLDGLRHFVYVTFRQDYSVVQIGNQYEVFNIGLVDQLFSNLLWIGGSSDAELMKASDKYEGCISNVEIELRSEENIISTTPVLQPISENVYAFQFVSYNQSDPQFTACASFDPPMPVTTVKPLPVTMPEWSVELQTIRHSKPTTSTTVETTVAVSPEVAEAEDPSTGWNKLGVAFAITACLTVLLVLLSCLLLWMKKQKRTYHTNEKCTWNGKRFPEISHDTKLLSEISTSTSVPSQESSQRSGEQTICSERTNIRDPSISSDEAEAFGDTYDLAPLRMLHGPYDRSSLDFKYVDENAQRLSREYPPPIPLKAK
uniref:EGF-like domain-containing protein n=1 Tax=Trichuris muris TaxID=70415 RepID=A0A5S6QAB0_TRIMR